MADTSQVPPLLPEDVRAFVYDAFACGNFDERDEDDAPKPAQTTAKSESALAAEKKRIRRLENVRLTPNLKEALERLELDRPNAGIFLDQDDIIVYDMPTAPDPFYLYTFYVVLNDDVQFKRGDRTIVYVNGPIIMAPLPCTAGLMRRFVADVFGDSSNDRVKELVRALKIWLERMQPDEPLTYDQIQDAILVDNARAMDKFTENRRVKRYFMHDRIELMRGYYNPDDIAELSTANIQSLSMYFDPESPGFPDPADLLFQHQLRKLSTGARKCRRLRELSETAWRQLCTLRKIPCDKAVEGAIRMYDVIKETIEEDMGKYVPEKKLALTDEKRGAIQKLIELGAIAREVTLDGNVCIYTRAMYHVEVLIVEALQRIFANAASYTFDHTVEPSETAVVSSVKPCSEQLRMMLYILRLPIVIVSGRGGAGKTDACAMAFRNVPPEQTVFLTYQSTNAANARSRVTSRAHTIHKLMSMHAKCCHLSPYISPAMKRKDKLKEYKQEMGFTYKKCPFESIRFAIIDECGMVYDELFAQALHALTTCGKLCRLIVCGDALQQAQTRPGRLFKDLIDGLPGWSLQFEHNHRISDDTARLFHKNLNAIYAMNLDEFEMNSTTNILYMLQENLDPAPVKRKPVVYKSVCETLESALRIAFMIHDIGDQEDLLVIARTRVLRDMASRIIKDTYHRSSDPGFIVRQKITYKRTDYDITPNLYNNEILMIDRIEDVRVDDDRKKDKKLDKAIVTSTCVVRVVESTSAMRDRERGVHRRIVCHVRTFPTEVRIIPWNPRHRRYVVPASAITERSVQGLESERIVAIKPGAWARADTHLSAGMVKGRAQKEIIWIAPPPVLQKWLTTPELPRLSMLGNKIMDAMKPYLLMPAYEPPQDVPLITNKIKQEEAKVQEIYERDEERKRRREMNEPESPRPAPKTPPADWEDSDYKRKRAADEVHVPTTHPPAPDPWADEPDDALCLSFLEDYESSRDSFMTSSASGDGLPDARTLESE